MVRQPEQGTPKKLIDAAEYWAGGVVVDDSQDDGAVLGVIWENEDEPSDFEVWPDNWEAVTMWNRVCTQWRTSMAGAIGLDYNVLQWLFEIYQVKDQRSLLEDLQTMEAAVLDYRARQGD